MNKYTVRRSPKRQRIFQKTGGRCWYCGQPLNDHWRGVTPYPPPNAFHVDHVTPRKKGGSNKLENLVAACASCNLSKGNKTLDEWRRAQARERRGCPPFSDEQREWLEFYGLDDPYEIAERSYEHILFWAEQEGLA